MNDLVTLEKSLEIAKPLKAIAELVRTLDRKYLAETIKQMKEQHSLRDSASILSPNPFTVSQQLELEGAKIKGLELILQLANNQIEILDKEVALVKAKRNENELGRIFGI